MSSREQILNSIAKSKPVAVPLPDVNNFNTPALPLIELFTKILTGIGGNVLQVKSLDDVRDYVKQNYTSTARIVTPIQQLADIAPVEKFNSDPHLLESVDLAILQPQFAVAENGAAWVTNVEMGDRALPFIAQHIALIVNKESIIQTMHEAYQRIGLSNYNYGVFIAGPSKTADIEQSLVLGAHGPKSMTVFIL
jgi:L-lactate dehydrogenase complex protein LldG